MSALTKITEIEMAGATSYDITSGIDATYKCYYFTFQNIHPSADCQLAIGLSNDGGVDNYLIAKTSAVWLNRVMLTDVTDIATEFRNYWPMGDDTRFQVLCEAIDASEADASMSGYLYLFNPSNTSYNCHYMWSTNCLQQSNLTWQDTGAGRTIGASAVNAVRFKTLDSPTATLDAGTITMWGLNTS
jgi:hypothetical protein|tara:strand:- start:728 stop:1288 length:561 start_codon:yes stop_codon:yes gene_type:complete